MKKSILAIIVCVSLASCEHEAGVRIVDDNGNNNGNNNGGNNGGNTNPCSPDTIYFNRDILPLLSSSCAYAGCHDKKTAEEGLILDNYDDIIRTGEVRAGNPGTSELMEVLTDSDPEVRMPPPPKTALTSAQIQILSKWISQGAKNNFCYSCDSSQFKFATDIMPMIQQNCTGCHGGSAPSKGIILTNYSDVKAVADNGKILIVLKSNGTIKMPP